MSEVLKTKPIINDCPEAVDTFVKPMSCPRCMNDVYSLGINMQYFIGNTYLQLAELNQGDSKNEYRNMAVTQLEGKAEIQRLANLHLNELLWHFYNNGGTITDTPVSEQQAKEKQPFFNRIIENFIENIDGSINLTSKGSMTPGELENNINEAIIDAYKKISKLFSVDEIMKAFYDLITIRTNIQNNN